MNELYRIGRESELRESCVKPNVIENNHKSDSSRSCIGMLNLGDKARQQWNSGPILFNARTLIAVCTVV